MKKTEFLHIFDDAIKNEDIRYIEVEVKNPQSSEFTSFGRNMFTEEYNYYNNNYDENMQLNSSKEDKVKNIRLLKDLAEL
ncbi:hypothetical protein [Clostridium massiliamazoniense]|uniref:hypothetical protein n=1 Tax=Clostridium massiliamazoniense TaxID=1347366 RepID=UPI0006D8234F|nr:hypothetical protein [Clostridium massiliamazoniense]